MSQGGCFTLQPTRLLFHWAVSSVAGGWKNLDADLPAPWGHFRGTRWPLHVARPANNRAARVTTALRSRREGGGLQKSVSRAAIGLKWLFQSFG